MNNKPTVLDRWRDKPEDVEMILEQERGVKERRQARLEEDEELLSLAVPDSEAYFTLEYQIHNHCNALASLDKDIAKLEQRLEALQALNDTPKATLRRTHPFMVYHNRLGWDVYGEMSPDDSYEIDGEDLVCDEEA